MLRRVLFENELCRLSVGLLGGMRIDIRASGKSIKVPRDCARYLDRVVLDYLSFGGKIEPADEGLAWIFEQFVTANAGGSDNPMFRIYYRETPEAHAKEAFEEFGDLSD
jgi:hypothetical protein